MALINCPECNAEVSDKAEVCLKCGLPIEALIACPECGIQNTAGTELCVKCGCPLNERGESVNASPVSHVVAPPPPMPQPIAVPAAPAAVIPVPPTKSKAPIIVAALIGGVCVVAAVLFFVMSGDGQKHRAVAIDGMMKNHRENGYDYSGVSSRLDFLRSLNGKYSHDVGLFEKPEFSQRLKSLLGSERYTFLKTYWNVTSPIEVNNNTFVAEGCQKHNCGSTNFIIVYDFLNNVMYAGIMEENDAYTYSEHGKHSPIVINWLNSQ